MIKSGELDKRLTIRRATKTINTVGEEVETFVDVATVWGKVKYLRGSERYAAKQVIANMELEFIIRFRPDVTVKDLIRYDGTDYDLYEILPIGKKEGLQIKAGI